ncbi:MAG: hypothetical protein QM733_02660 [Ilumatobacteraceae bacterium]
MATVRVFPVAVPVVVGAGDDVAVLAGVVLTAVVEAGGLGGAEVVVAVPSLPHAANTMAAAITAMLGPLT